jgi:hypothetical protein
VRKLLRGFTKKFIILFLRDSYIILDSAVDSHKKAQKAQRNTDAKILELTRQVKEFLIGSLMYLFVFAPFVPFCGNSNWVF